MTRTTETITVKAMLFRNELGGLLSVICAVPKEQYSPVIAADRRGLHTTAGVEIWSIKWGEGIGLPPMSATITKYEEILVKLGWKFVSTIPAASGTTGREARRVTNSFLQGYLAAHR